jgi:hypothetical protein
VLGIFEMGSHEARLASSRDPPDVCLLSS